MFTPLRYQATESDCYPTCVLNALVRLFERHELPGAILQHVYAASLDGMDHGVTGAYTSAQASLALIDWLTRFRTRSFAVAADVLEGTDIRLDVSGNIQRCLRRGAVAILDVIETPNTTHSILALACQPRYIDFWDPYTRGPKFDYGRGTLRLDSDGYTPNLRVPLSWLDSTRIRPYSMGPLRQRTCVVMRRVKPARP